MNIYDIKCKIIEEELKSVWPDWHVACRLGSGSFGDVFQIYRDNFGIRVDAALKVIQVDYGTADYASTVVLPLNRQDSLNPGDSGQTSIVDSLRNEIQIMEALYGAPNIVVIEDYYFKQDDSASSVFVRMELLTSLLDVLKGQNEQHTLSSIREIRKFGRDICTALMYCEKKGIIHRDIKPSNLFLDSFGNYKVGDFGSSRHMDTLQTTQSMTGIGTFSYMAPEVFRGRSYNNTVDIYSLGLVMYQLLNNGRMPFLPASGSYTAQDLDSANYRRLHGTSLPELTGKNVGGELIDSRLDHAVRKACSMDPKDRFQKAEEFYEALSLTGTTEQYDNAVFLKNTLDTLPPDISLLSHHDKKRNKNIKGLVSRIVIVLILATVGLAVWKGSGNYHGSSLNAEAGMTAVSSVNVGEDVASIPLDGKDEKEPDPELPEEESIVEDSVSGQITDSWEEIIAAGEDGTYIDKYQIGDTKDLDLGEEGMIEMELVAFDSDELADESGKAHMTWIAKTLLNTECRINSQDKKNHGGWPESDLRAWMQGSVLPLFPDTVRSNIKKVKKYSFSYTDKGTISSEDKLWIPSTREVFGAGNTREDEGPEYLEAYPDDASRHKYHADSFDLYWWWLRSTDYYSDYFFASVDYDVYNQNTGDHLKRHGGVVVGFCL